MRRWLLMIAVVAGALLVAGTDPPPALAKVESSPPRVVEGGTTLSNFSIFGRIVVDDAHQRVFLSSGASGSTVYFLGFDGSVQGTLTNIPGASGMVIVGNHLYIAAMNADRIEDWDLSTNPPTKISNLSTAPEVQPREIAYVGGLLVFTSKCDGGFDSKLVTMNTDGSSVTSYGAPGNEFWSACPDMDTSPDAPGMLFLQPHGMSPTPLYEFRISSGVPTEVVHSDFGGAFWGGQVAAYKPSSLLLPGGGAPGVNEFSSSDLSGPNFEYGSNATGKALAETAQDGGHVATAANDPFNDVVVWRPGVAAPSGVLDFGDDTSHLVAERGLAFSADGSKLFVVTGGYSPAAVIFYAVDPNKSSSNVTLSTSSTWLNYGTPATLSGHLTGGSTNNDVQIWSISYLSNTPVLLQTVSTDSTGAYSTTVEPPQLTKYFATYSGDAFYAPSSTPQSGAGLIRISVSPAVTGALLGAYRTSGGYSFYHNGNRPVRFYSTVSPDFTGDKVTIVLQYQKPNANWKDLASNQFRLGPGSAITVKLDVGGWPAGTRARFQTRFKGREGLENGESDWAYFKVTG